MSVLRRTRPPLSEEDTCRCREQIAEHRHHIFKYILVLAKGDTGLAEDLSQETAAACARNYHELEDKGKFRAWGIAIARNVARSAFRKAGRRDKKATIFYKEDVEGFRSQRADPLSVMVYRQESDEIWEALMTLRMDYREVVYLSVWPEYSNPQISKILHTPVGTVKWRRHEGLKELKKILEDIQNHRGGGRGRGPGAPGSSSGRESMKAKSMTESESVEFVRYLREVADPFQGKEPPDLLDKMLAAADREFKRSAETQAAAMQSRQRKPLLRLLTGDRSKASRPTLVLRWGSAVAFATAVVTIATYLFGPPSARLAVAKILEPVLHATGFKGGVHLVMNVREQGNEEFGYVDLDGKMVRMEAWVQWPAGDADKSDKGRMRIDKPDWIYSFDGTGVVYYWPDLRMAKKHDVGSARLDLLWPAAWVEDMMDLPRGGKILEHVEQEGEGRILVSWPAPDLNGREPKWFNDFPREVEIRWNLSTKQLMGMRRWVRAGLARKVLVAELVAIEYLPNGIPQETFQVPLPEDVRLVQLVPAPPEIDALGPREAAERFWKAAIAQDWNTVAYFVPNPVLLDFLKKAQPKALISLGEPIKSGQFIGMFVPYEVRYVKRGPRTKHRVAMRNDNEFGRWVVDGGI